MDDIIGSAFGAKLPWKSVDAGASTLKGYGYYGDTQEQIDKCLSCSRLACVNCLYERTSNRPRRMKVLCGQIEITELKEEM